MSTGTAEVDRAADDAAAVLRDSEADLATGRRTVSADALHRHLDNYRHAQLAAEGAKAKAERAAATARITALGEVGRQVDDLAAADVVDELRDVLQVISDGCARARSITQDWDDSVRKLISTAAGLGVGEPPPGGPAKASGFLAVRTSQGSQFITHHRVRLTLVGTDLSRAIDRAVLGRPHDGLLLINGVTELPEPQRPRYVVRGRGGVFTPLEELTEAQWAQVKTGDLQLLEPDEVEAWLRGEPLPKQQDQ